MPMDLKVEMPQGIKPTSWLNEPQYEWFQKGYSYSATQTNAISAMSKASAEELYFFTWSVLRTLGIDPEKVKPTVAPLNILSHVCTLCKGWKEQLEEAAKEHEGEERLRLLAKAEGCDLIRACVEELARGVK